MLKFVFSTKRQTIKETMCNMAELRPEVSINNEIFT